MELWYFFYEKLTFETKKGVRLLKQDDAYLIGRVAEMEGEMLSLFKHGDTSNHWGYIKAIDIQSTLRRMFENTFPNEPLPEKLKPGYKPKGSMSD